jgi:hypothetical protein
MDADSPVSADLVLVALSAPPLPPAYDTGRAAVGRAGSTAERSGGAQANLNLRLRDH